MKMTTSRLNWQMLFTTVSSSWTRKYAYHIWSWNICIYRLQIFTHAHNCLWKNSLRILIYLLLAKWYCQQLSFSILECWMVRLPITTQNPYDRRTTYVNKVEKKEPAAAQQKRNGRKTMKLKLNNNRIKCAQCTYSILKSISFTKYGVNRSR